MKIPFVVILFLAILSCKATEKSYSQNFDSAELMNIDFNPGSQVLARFNDSDMEQGVRRVYRAESDAIENVSEIEPSPKVLEILDKPFENSEIGILSEYSQKRLFSGIEELLNVFNATTTQDIIESFNSNDSYKTIKMSIENLSLYVYREYNNGFKLFFIEYSKNNFYEPKLKIGYSKEDIVNLLGNPSAYSDERDLFIYNSQKTLRQMNIYFENNIVKHVQLISWGGV